ncbi:MULTISPECIES: hypothetical protein [Nocardia]|uniref:hypothetical protein n=1 Tax=Nocardia TaxID=1817 RepID=UPI0024538BDF|nr:MULTISPECIES: hypothetical protein [Nocardia]
MSIRVVAICCVAPLIVAVLVSCSGPDLVRDGLRIGAGPGCVDAHGPNSTLDELADAMMSATFTDPTTGKRTSAEEQARAAANAFESMTGPLGSVDTSPAAIRAKLVKSLYSAVPEGGDARFAEAVCEYDTSVLTRLGPMWGDRDQITRTPHLLRASGRTVCGGVGDQTADAYLEEIDEQATAAQADPQAYVAGEINKIEAVLDGWTSDPEETDAGRQIRQSFEEALRVLRAQEPQQIADGLRKYRDFNWLAIEHLCPGTSVFGFGEVCGEVSSPLGHAPRTVRTHSGPVDCDSALDIVQTFSTEGPAAILPWVCAYNNDGDTAEDVMIYCHNQQARVVVPRKTG